MRPAIKTYRVQVSLIEIVDENDKEKDRPVDTLYVNTRVSVLEWNRLKFDMTTKLAESLLKNACGAIVFGMAQKFAKNVLGIADD